MNFGRYTIKVLETGRLRLDGGAMFGVVPKPLWEKSNAVDERNRIAMTMRSLLLRDGERTILIDTGAGTKESEKFHAIYALDHSEHSLENALNAHGVAPSEVTDVILTHLHFDHCGGCVKESDGRLEPVFHNARHYVQKQHWEWAMRPSDRDRASFLPDNYLPLQDAGLLAFVDGEESPFEDIGLHVVNGHTFGQQLVRIQGRDRSLLYAADLVPMSSHVPGAWIMGYDLQPLVTLEEKTALLERAVRDGDILVFEHDTVVEAATIKKSDKGFTLDASGTLNSVLEASC